MASSWVVVCLPPGQLPRRYLSHGHPDGIEAAINEAMAPFQAQVGHAPERDIWDWWTIRGASNGLGFAIRPGCEDDPRLVYDTALEDGTALASLPGMCAGGPKGLLDLARAAEMPRAELLTVDGWWVETGVVLADGGIGFTATHGACESRAACPHLADAPDSTMDVTAYLENLDDDVFFVNLRLHT